MMRTLITQLVGLRPTLRLFAAASGAITLLLPIAAAQADEPAPSAAPVVVARVGGEPIYAGEVTAELRTLLKNKKVDAAAQPRLLAEMLALLIDRRLVIAYLAERQQAADPAEVDAKIQKMKALAKQRGTSLEAQAAAQGVTEDAVRADIRWRLSWKSYVDEHVTDAVLEQFFNAHRRDFDGTQIRASQILLSAPDKADDAARQALLAQAADLRGQIVAGKLKFEDAVARFSAGASKQTGGDLGYLARHGSVPDDVAAAVFALEKDQLSQPIATPYGVHLLKVTDIKPGQKTPRESASALKSAVVQQGFRRIADAQRAKTSIEFTDAMPHLDPKTGQLVPK